MKISAPKILVVDDKPANLVAMKRLLSKTIAEVLVANSGNEALSLTLEHDFAVILLDINMPGMDGFEVAEYLAGAENTRDIPLIFLTAAFKDDTHAMKAYGSGAVDYIEKPVNEPILLAKVDVFLDLYIKNQALIAAVERAERANLFKTDFLSCMSHDLRTPLNGIIGFGQLLKMDPQTPLTEAQTDYVDTIINSGNHLLALVNGILDLSKIEAGMMELELERLDVADLINEIVETTVPLAEQMITASRL